MGGSKYNKLLGNKFIAKYKNSLAYLSSSKKTSQKEAYNYLQQSIIPTMHFQKSLTKLQIPKLDDTMNRYLNSLKPLLSEQEWQQAEKITREFEKNEAVELDREIRELDKQDKSGNYISEPWFDMYLKARESIVLNYNPFIIFQPDPVKAQNDQAIRAANFLVSSMRFMKSLRADKLKPEIFHLNPEKSETVFFERLMRMIPESVSFYGAYMFNAYPLDMSQYFRLFNSTRIPKKGKDVLFADQSQKHILILHKGNFYVFPLLDESGNILSPEHIYACVKHILESRVPAAEHSIGVLTTENRDTWASVREHLESLGDNKKHLRAIDSAFYCLCLDDFESSREEAHGSNSLTGDGKNRWFDKNLQLICTKDGQVSINFEHSWGDGVAIVRLLNELYDDTTKRPFVSGKTKPAMDKEKLEKVVRKLEFKLDDRIKSAIEQANKTYVQAQSSVKLRAFNNPHYGRSFVKNYNISPDLVMQSGIQIAYYKTFGHFVSTYESASTSAFKHGRTETVRPLTLQTRRLAEYMSRASGKQDAGEVMQLMKEASKVHNQLVKEGAMGQGFDRHLFALKYHAANRRNQAKLPSFYDSHAYKLINHNILSTSTLAYPAIQMGGFAPVVPDGFGIGYRILDESLGACVSCYDSAKLNKFASSLEETYSQLHTLFKSVKKPDASKK